MYRRRLAFTILAVAVCGGPAGAQEYAWRRYGAEAGLPTANAVTFDGAGTLLVGTNDGLSRFDGRAFVEMPLPVPGGAWRLVTAPDGAVWGLTTRAAIFRISPAGPASAIPVPEPLRVRLHEQVWPIRIHADASSRLWISGGDGAICRWEGPERRVWSCVRVPGVDFVGDFFVRGDREEGDLVIAARNRIAIIPLRQGRAGVARWLPDFEQPLTFIRPHPDALAWVGGEGGVFLVQRSGRYRRMLPEGERVWPHHEPDVDLHGRLLTVGEAMGTRVLRFAADGTIELSAGHDEGLRSMLPTGFAFDPEGGFWMAYRGGVVALHDERTRMYVLPEGREEIVSGMIYDPGRNTVWVSTFGGVYKREGGRFERVSAPGLRFSVSPQVAADGLHWTEITPEGMFRPSSSGDPPAGLALIVHDSARGRYETDAAGVWRVRGGARDRISARRLAGVVGSFDSRGRLWLGGENPRLDVVWGDSLGSECQRCLPPSLRAAIDSLNSRLAAGRVSVDSYDRVWVPGGTGGVGVLWPRADGAWEWRVFFERDGLLANSVYTLSISPDGQRMWLATFRGIQGVSLAPGTPRIIPLVEIRAQDGLDDEVAMGATEDRDGFLWAALTPGRIHRLDWRSLSRRPPSPSVRIERIEVNGRPVDGRVERLRLREGDGLALALAARTYRQPLRVRLEYRLDETETAWSSLGTGRQLTLAALPARRYTLEVRAVREGRPPGPPVRLVFSVRPPFYRSAWFGGLALLAIAVLGWGIRRSRLERRHAAAAVRQRIAEDLHDEVGSGLTQVALHSELIRRLAEGTAGDASPGNGRADIAGLAVRVGEQASVLSGSMRDLVWAIRPEQRTWEELELRLKDVAVALLAPHGIQADLHGEVEGAPPTLPAEVSQNVLLFAKEAIHNAVRHASPSRVEIQWTVSRRAVTLQVSDDGRGFDPETARRGVGLTSMRRRAETLGGRFALTAASGEGTRVTLDVPLGRGRVGLRSD